MSRTFIRTALERPPIGLADEIRHLYFQKGRLKTVIEHATRLMEMGEAGDDGREWVEEENEQMWNADAMGSLTKGAIITLKVSRTSDRDVRVPEAEVFYSAQFCLLRRF